MKPTTIFAKILVTILFVFTCSAQSKPSVDELLRNLANDDLATGSANQLAAYGSDPRTVPALRSKFLNSRDKLIKQSISATMLRLKIEDPAYFNYLASFAWEAVNIDAPSIFLLKNRRPERINPKFEEWCKLHGKDVDEGQIQYSGYMTDMMRLIGAHDERAAPIFRKGLFSNNPYIVLESVLGLADLGHPSDIEPIIEVADRSEADIDPGVATALARFRNPRDRELIAKRLQGSRLYDNYVIAVKADDQLRAAEKTKAK
jgi:hypothetical protein